MTPFAADELSSWAALVSSVANIGFAALVGWYLLTKAIPKMQDDFRTESKETRIEHREALNIVVMHCERETERRDQSFKIEMQEVGKFISDSREVMEEVRDVLRSVNVVVQDHKR